MATHAGNESLDLDTCRELQKAVATAAKHLGDAGGFGDMTVKHLQTIVDDFTVQARTIRLTPPDLPFDLDHRAKGLVRRMQILIEDQPVHVATQLHKLANRLYKHLTGLSRQPVDDESLWVPEQYVEDLYLTDAQLLQRQNESLPTLEKIPQNFTNVPEPEELTQENEPDQFNEFDSEDERNNIITPENYPLNDYLLSDESSSDNESSSCRLDAKST
ncbi:hypothetical protein PTMSG1_00348 [Pyrenophora teres f. maculata]|nr:hypothetical protein PTMSG1_00348 [Pyrenophora teres f. maculata]